MKLDSRKTGDPEGPRAPESGNERELPEALECEILQAGKCTVVYGFSRIKRAGIAKFSNLPAKYNKK